MQNSCKEVVYGEYNTTSECNESDVRNLSMSNTHTQDKKTGPII